MSLCDESLWAVLNSVYGLWLFLDMFNVLPLVEFMVKNQNEEFPIVFL